MTLLYVKNGKAFDKIYMRYGNSQPLDKSRAMLQKDSRALGLKLFQP